MRTRKRSTASPALRQTMAARCLGVTWLPPRWPRGCHTAARRRRNGGKHASKRRVPPLARVRKITQMQTLTRLSPRPAPTTPAYTLVNRLRSDSEAQREELLRGLLSAQAAIAPKYFYDPLGAALFTAICELDEYYPPRTEAAIFAQHRGEIARAIGYGRQLVDLGAGDCAKAEHWFDTLRPTRYVAVDIAEAGLHTALARIAQQHDEIELAGVVTDFSERLELRRDLAAMPTTFFYPGSSIG